MLSSSSVLGCTILVSSVFFVASNPIPQTPYNGIGQYGMMGAQPGMMGGQPGMLGGQPGMLGGQTGMLGGQTGMLGGQPGMLGGHPGQSYMNGVGSGASPYPYGSSSSRIAGHQGFPGVDESYNGLSRGAEGSPYIPGTAGRTASNAGILGATDGGHGGYHGAGAHLSIPSTGWFLISGFVGLLTLAL